MKITQKDGFSQTWERQIRNPQLLSFQMRYGMSFEHSDPFQRPVYQQQKWQLKDMMASVVQKLSAFSYIENMKTKYITRTERYARLCYTI